MTKQELRQFRRQSVEVRQLRQHLEELINLTAPTAAYDREPVNGGQDGSTVERAVEKIITLANKYEAYLNAYAAERCRIEQAFEVLTPDERAVMRAYYFDNRTWEQVSEDLCFSYRQVHYLHSAALFKIK